MVMEKFQVLGSWLEIEVEAKPSVVGTGLLCSSCQTVTGSHAGQDWSPPAIAPWS